MYPKINTSDIKSALGDAKRKKRPICFMLLQEFLPSTYFCNLLFFQWNLILQIQNRLIYFNPYSLKDHIHTTVGFIAFLSKTLVKLLKILFSNEEFVHRASLFIDYSSRKFSNPSPLWPAVGRRFIHSLLKSVGYLNVIAIRCL